ncbi:MAG: helix-hairpin-helix domain-containing protein [Candidatus Symbiothrix sp.]|jgi:DNA uptake protein ComE-like DNA-binding protein|nr:helix-hairpin-helix domain-containing protein [Candidatus Symbiothrix sp.]
MNWKDFFYFSQRERRGIVLLLVFIAGIFAGKWLFKPKDTPPMETTATTENESPPAVHPVSTPEMYVPYFSHEEPYRQKKRYQSPKQPEQRTYYDRKNEEEPVPKQSQFPKTEKFTEGTVIELNAADSTDLIKIPGIGPAFARRIIAYKNRLGGYHRIEQLQEVYEMYEELYVKIVPFFRIDNQLITPININQASLDRLKMHPYINFYQAKAIIEIRKKKGRINHPDELYLLEEFTADDWLRLHPYFSYAIESSLNLPISQNSTP